VALVAIAAISAATIPRLAATWRFIGGRYQNIGRMRSLRRSKWLRSGGAGTFGRQFSSLAFLRRAVASLVLNKRKQNVTNLWRFCTVGDKHL